MAKKSQPSPKRTTQPQSADSEFATFAFEEANDDKILKTSLWCAVGLHLILLLINFPNFATPEAIEPEKKEVIRLTKTPRFKPPEVRPKQIPPKRVKKVPIPALDPEAPEPILPDEPEVEIDIPDIDTDFFAIPEAPPAPPAPTGPVIVAGDIVRPEKTHAPQPSYTEVARKTRTQGTVILQAVIDREGNVSELKVLKGLPMGLTEESLKTVKNWKYTPATLHGKPISVYLTLTVHFKLQ